MDLSLPNVDGLEATQLIRGHSAIAQVPIIFLTGRAEPASHQAAVEAGCNDFLVKPIHLDTMFTTVARWLNLRAGSRQTRMDGVQ
jgi:CheY-like chemotaxis protein